MISIAHNKKGLLVKEQDGHSFWYNVILPNWEIVCLHDQTSKYGAVEALESFTKTYGLPKWINPHRTLSLL